MKDDINLVSGGKVEEKIKRSQDPLIIFFGVVFLVAIILIASSFILSAVLSSQNTKIADLKSNISQSAKKQKIAIVSDRLSQIRTILSQRSKVSPTASKIVAEIPASFTINNLSADSQKIQISITSDKLSDYVSFLQGTLPAFLKKNQILLSSVNIDSFTLQENGYEMSLVFNVKLTKKQ